MALSGPPFRFSIKQSEPRLIEIEYIGHMGEDDVEHLRQTEALLRDAREPVGLFYQVTGFTGFHRSQVANHGALFTRQRSKIVGVGIVGARPVVRFGAISVSMISHTPIETFEQRSDALAWLSSQLKSQRP